MSESKINVFLDLDNTLICALDKDELDKMKKTDRKKYEYLLKSLEFFDIGDYLVFKRPHLDEFMDFLFKHFNVNVWSAASKNYVNEIITNIMQQSHGKMAKYVFFSNHCGKSEKYHGGIKNLNLIFDGMSLATRQFRKENTLIIDDLEEVKTHNPINCLRIYGFEVEEPGADKDSALVEKMDQLKYILQNYGKKEKHTVPTLIKKLDGR